MKRKIIAVLLAAIMVTSVTACGNTQPNASELTSGRSVVSEEGENTEKPEETEKEEEKEPEEKEPEEKEDDKDKTAAKGVVFGSDEAKGYDGFDYLMEELISTSDTKSGNKASFSVFVPEDDYPSVSGSSARSDRMGVTFEVDLEPYLQYNAKDYTISENLEEFVEDEFSYSTYKYGIEIGDVVEIDDDTATCLVSYMDYNSYDDEYSPVYELYKLQDIGDGVTVLFTVSIDAEETTGKTQALLKELSSFYQMDIDWDDSFAEAKRTAFENSDEYNADAFNLVYMSFELPDGWEKDEKNSTYSEPVFAPGGNARTANGYIQISKEYSSDDYVEALLDDPAYTEEALQSSMGDEVSDVKVEAMEDTFMGRVAKVEMNVYDNDIDGNGIGIVYYGYYDYTMYMIAAFISEDADADEIEDVRAAIDMIFETGKMKN
ncbi:MAG: hypothetical protein K2K21_05445 [Lachnospiraceae bacterium]|nr:hypothetical protein [Lachnospiraceae bacterium]